MLALTPSPPAIRRITEIVICNTSIHCTTLAVSRNVVKLLDFVLEWQNPYSVTVNVVVPLHNLTLSRIWLLTKGVDVRLDMCLNVSVSKPSTGRGG